MVKSLDELRLSITRSSLLTNPLFLSALFIISLAFILYVFLSYYTQEENKQYKTYLNTDLTDTNYLFRSDDEQNDDYQEQPTLDQCVELCKLNTKCDGLTYNEDTQQCLLTEEGQFRDGNINHYAWQKPRDEKNKITVKTNIIDYTNKPINVSKYRIPPPRFSGSFSYSFWINITNWYTDNYGYWKHVFHKGTQINDSRKAFKKWSDVENTIPEQMIGVWLAPYNNNLRICYNFTQLQHTTSIVEEATKKYSKTNCYTDPNTGEKKCVQSIVSDVEEDKPEYINTNYIELYAGKNYTGHKTKIYISNRDITTNDGIFSPDKLLNLHYRPKSLSSIKVPYTTKIELMDFNDKTSKIIDQNIPDLSKLNFDNKMTKFRLIAYKSQDERLDKGMGYYDITNIDINIPTHVLLNFNDTYIDIYINGKLKGTQNLLSLDNKETNINRQFKTNNGDLYAKYPTSFSGSIYNLGYVPEYLSSENIQKIYNQKPSLDYDKTMGTQTLTLENFTSDLVNNVIETDINTYDH